MIQPKSRQHNAANEAILQTSRLFTDLWGDAELSENGDVHFSGLPKTLHGLTAIQTWQRQLLGGTMSVNFSLTRQIDETVQCRLYFRNGAFRSKDGETAHRLIEPLHADTVLMQTLTKLDLIGLTITLANGTATIVLTPYGGGLAFLALPPVRYAVSFPQDQIKETAQVLERLAHIVCRQCILQSPTVC